MNLWLLLVMMTNFVWIYFSTALFIDPCAHIWVIPWNLLESSVFAKNFSRGVNPWISHGSSDFGLCWGLCPICSSLGGASAPVCHGWGNQFICLSLVFFSVVSDSHLMIIACSETSQDEIVPFLLMLSGVELFAGFVEQLAGFGIQCRHVNPLLLISKSFRIFMLFALIDVLTTRNLFYRCSSFI